MCNLFLLLVAENSMRRTVKIACIAFSVASVSRWPAGILSPMPSVLCVVGEKRAVSFWISQFC